ncbi:hypothetical protein TRFO_29695 [Tritrichomonas foetus]|uniref:VWFA domain-containing protein n=1 Tax=Tritrichomonas foetus TaxID=1144522 RepID=A0A1J4JX45_9EUKA|nr:hypothetical protein TRFO_29695 [Tritrichomonas foetus]|eukprot:OHT03032.1 hypothetical protein TRFO_29695 [Tritrichomonas foetus]
MNMKLLVAYDFSGSTYSSEFYHETVQKVLEHYDDYDVVCWNHDLLKSSKENLQNINKKRNGTGRTMPIKVAEYLSNTKFEGRVILITDGMISESDVYDLDEYLKTHEIKIKQITCHIIQSQKNQKLDATVLAPFLRDYHYDVTLHSLDHNESVSLAKGGCSYDEFIKMIQNINSIEEFENKYYIICTSKIPNTYSYSKLTHI